MEKREEAHDHYKLKESCLALSMRGNFEFPGSLGEKRKSDKSYDLCYLGKEENQFLQMNQVFLSNSCKIYFFPILT